MAKTKAGPPVVTCNCLKLYRSECRNVRRDKENAGQSGVTCNGKSVDRSERCDL